MYVLLKLDILYIVYGSAGGPWHITDMRRGESIFELDPYAQEEVERGFELEGSNLSGVSGRCSWSEQDGLSSKEGKDTNIRLDTPYHQNLLSKLSNYY